MDWVEQIVGEDVPVPGNDGNVEEESLQTICHVCGLAKENFSSTRDYFSHVEAHGEKLFLCEECGANFTSQRNLYFHTKKSHQKTLSCNLCEKTFAKIHKRERRLLQNSN